MGIACLLQQPPVRYLLYKHGAYHRPHCSSVLALIGLKVYRISTMKFLVVLALFAAASAEPEAEADPWYYYTHGAAAYHPYTYGYGYPYYQYVLPTVKAAEERQKNQSLKLRLLKSNQLSTPTHTTMEDMPTHTHTDTMDTMVDTVDTTTENRLLQDKYRMWLPQKQDKNHQQNVKISKHITLLNYV